MSGFKNFAVAGAGNLGKYIVDEFAKLKKVGTISSIVVLTRSAGPRPEFTDLGAELAKIDYDSVDSLQSALEGIDVVVMTINSHGDNPAEENLAIAAKKSGVKLFVPSEFGCSTIGRTDDLFGVRERFRRRLLELDLPQASFFTGIWPDLCFAPSFGFDLANNKVTIGGEGEIPVSLTGRRDVARYLTHVLTALPRSKLENRFFRMEGERTTYNKILEEYQERTGKTLVVTHTPAAEIEAVVKSNPTDFINILWYEWDVVGRGVVGTPEEVTNDEYPEWNPQKAVDVWLESLGQSA